MNFIWKKKYETGIKEIDDQHKYFFVLVNDLYDAINTDENEKMIENIISDLKDYTQYHFSSEEELLKTINFPEYEIKAHIKSHTVFIKNLRDIESDTSISLNIKAYQLADFLKKWLTEHILNSDMKYAQFYKSKQQIIY